MTQTVARPTEAMESRYGNLPGIRGFLTAVQATSIGQRYMVTAFAFLLLGGLEGLFMRLQLAQPGNQVLDAQRFNELFTMHGTTMMFLFAVPFLEGLATYLLPQQLGCRDMPFPRYNAFNYWCYLFAGLLLYSSFLVDLVPDSGWFAYVPLSGPEYADVSMDIWLFGLALAELAAIGAAIEIVVAVLKTRAPGMSLDRLPIMAWTMLSVALMILAAFVPLLVASTLLELDRGVGTVFFEPLLGGDPLLWQHLFWIFGHPEVYVMFLPGAAIISHILPIHARTHLVGYPFVVMAIIVTAIMSLGLWVHHMYTVGLPPVTLSFFTAASMAITLASGVQVFAWIATLWVGRPRFTVPMLFSLGFIFTFVAGGITGVMVASAPFDAQVHDTYFVVAHFHYVIIGGMLFPVFAGLVHWWPKITGRMVNRLWGKIAFWLVFLGFHVTFFPMHLLGLWGMPRRVYTYPPGLGLDFANLLSTIGAFVLALGVLVLTVALVLAAVRGRSAPADPWGGDSLEWAIASPTPNAVHERIPEVGSRHPLWDEPDAHQRYAAQRAPFDHAPTHVRATMSTTIVDAEPQGAVRLADPTIWPLIAALGLLGAAVGVLLEVYAVSLAFLLLFLVALGGWAWRNESEMGEDDTAPLGELLVEAPGPRGIGWWAALSTTGVLLVGVATLAFSTSFLQVNSTGWAPHGIVGQWLPTVAVGLLVVVAGAATWWGSREGEDHLTRAAGPTGPHLIAAGVALAAGIGAIVLTILTWSRSGLDLGAHAYNSAAFVLLCTQALTIAFASGMTAVALLARLRHARDIRPRMLLANATLGWAGVLLAWAVVWAMTDLLPTVLV